MSEKVISESRQDSGSWDAWEQEGAEEKYQAMSLEERKSGMLREAWQSIRWQGESGYDEYAMFTKEAYQSWKSRDSQIDEILDFVIKHLADMLHENEKEFSDEINRRLGRVV